MPARGSNIGVFVCALGLLMLAGCGFEWTYVTAVVGGEMDLLASAVPIEVGLADPTLSDEEREKLGIVIEARDYASGVIGLNSARNYRTFANLHGEPLAWNLSASPKDAIEPYTWQLPFVGSIAYLGFFTLDEATAERDRLVAAGFDTLIYEVDAFSTLGLLPDPVTSALLRRPVYSLVDTVIHELTHATVYSGGDTVFDESVAVFVARTGADQFLVDRYGADSDIVRRAREDDADAERFNGFLAGLRAELEVVYAGDLSREEKIEARGPIFEAARQRVTTDLLPLVHHPEEFEHYQELAFNNAFLLVNARYNTNLDIFRAVYESVGQDWKAMMEVLRQASVSADPFGFLRQRLAP